MWQKRESAKDMRQKGSSEKYKALRSPWPWPWRRKNNAASQGTLRPVEAENVYQPTANKEPISLVLQRYGPDFSHQPGWTKKQIFPTACT